MSLGRYYILYFRLYEVLDLIWARVAVGQFTDDAELVHYLHGILGLCLSDDELDIESKKPRHYAMNSMLVPG